MYKHGKPIYRFKSRPLAVIFALIILVLGFLYFKFVAHGQRTEITSNNKPLISTVTAGSANTTISEKDFSLTLPGKWKLAQKDWDARYRAWQWQLQDPKVAAGRWFRIYEDTIPTDYAYNYLMPVSSNGISLNIGQVSGACTDFTTTAQTHTNSSGTIAAVSKWQQVSFYCDYGRQTLQTVGTSSTEGINTVTLEGQSRTKHKYFFLYQDNNINPDLGLPATILSTFMAK